MFSQGKLMVNRKNWVPQLGFWAKPAPQRKLDLLLGPSGSHLRDPCSGPQAVYQDLSTHYDWACIKSHCSIGQIRVRWGLRTRISAPLLCKPLPGSKIPMCRGRARLIFPFRLNLVSASSLLLSESLAQATASHTWLVGVRLRLRRRLQSALIWVNKG